MMDQRISIDWRVCWALIALLCACGEASDHSSPTEIETGVRSMSLEQMLDQPDISGRVFHPRQYRSPTPAAAKDYDIEVAEGIRVGARWYIGDSNWRTVVAFHGNGETVSDYDDIAAYFHRIELNLFMTDYRGYGWSNGSPSLSTYVADGFKVAAFAQAEIKKETPDAPAPFVFGRSMGSGPASALAAEAESGFGGVIIESGFADIEPLFQLFMIDPAEYREEARKLLSNHIKLNKTELPVLILHGQNDFLIAVTHAHLNFESISHDQKTLHVLPEAGHNDMLFYADEYFGAIRSFAADL